MQPSMACIREQVLDPWFAARIPPPQSATLGLNPIAASYYSFPVQLMVEGSVPLKSTFNAENFIRSLSMSISISISVGQQVK